MYNIPIIIITIIRLGHLDCGCRPAEGRERHGRGVRLHCGAEGSGRLPEAAGQAPRCECVGSDQ